MSGHVMRVDLDIDIVVLRPECREPADADCRRDCGPGECQAVLYLESSGGVAEYFDGPPAPLHDGMPIIVTWHPDSECYTWAPAEPIADEWSTPDFLGVESGIERLALAVARERRRTGEPISPPVATILLRIVERLTASTPPADYRESDGGPDPRAGGGVQ